PVGRHLLALFDGGKRALVAQGLSAGVPVSNLGVFARDEQVMGSVRADGLVPLVIAIPELTTVETLPAHAGPVLAGAVSPEGRYVATSSMGGQVHRRDRSGTTVPISVSQGDVVALRWGGLGLVAG